eukprot:CAMPEP_0175010508 /NCGR_PEP_ID=MMETSP0005-20121125/8138_1 /TAXON_ID=420556 /ORGANISM="Ochromonas sp., Strain CCMP1393" /LENGTH=138 /DNA_ID=CAMNT_0016266333 /DNA_START=736 /DNA_END=1152 /DNA_ORIENTATION=+
MKIANYVDSKRCNLLSEKTANIEREKARKAIAPAFSLSNLQKTWPYTKQIMQEQFRELPRLKETFMPFSLGRRTCPGQNMAMFQLRVVVAHFLYYYDFEFVGEPQFEIGDDARGKVEYTLKFRPLTDSSSDVSGTVPN